MHPSLLAVDYIMFSNHISAIYSNDVVRNEDRESTYVRWFVTSQLITQITMTQEVHLKFTFGIQLSLTKSTSLIPGTCRAITTSQLHV